MLQVNLEMIREFEKNLNPRFPEKSIIPAKVLGFGEISTVLEIGEKEEDKKYAYKRMPLFFNQLEIDDYKILYREYHTLLEKIGIKHPKYLMYNFREYDRIIFYGIQEKVDYHSVGNRILSFVKDEEIHLLINLILKEIKKVFAFNQQNKGKIEIGIDSQISNWAIKDFDYQHPQLNEDMELIYFDTSTPLIKKNGKEQLDPELFLRSAPSFLVWIIRKLFLAEVMERYYNPRQVIIDIIANFYKEQRSDIIPAIIKTVNTFLVEELASFHIEPITLKEVKAYYREDAFIWRFYLAARKLDRILHKILKKPYLHILPKKIKR